MGMHGVELARQVRMGFDLLPAEAKVLAFLDGNAVPFVSEAAWEAVGVAMTGLFDDKIEQYKVDEIRVSRKDDGRFRCEIVTR